MYTFRPVTIENRTKTDQKIQIRTAAAAERKAAKAAKAAKAEGGVVPERVNTPIVAGPVTPTQEFGKFLFLSIVLVLLLAVDPYHANVLQSVGKEHALLQLLKPNHDGFQIPESGDPMETGNWDFVPDDPEYDDPKDKHVTVPTTGSDSMEKFADHTLNYGTSVMYAKVAIIVGGAVYAVSKIAVISAWFSQLEKLKSR